MKFIVDRSKWRCGGDGIYAHGYNDDTKLLDQQGMMCCMGQVECQLGLTLEDLLDKFTPRKTEKLNILTEALTNDPLHYIINRAWVRDSMEINDDKDLNRSEREEKLIEIFAENGHTLQFVGLYGIAGLKRVA